MHSIILQVGQTPSFVVKQTINVDVDKIRKESQIYQLKADDKLYEYHKAINEACFAEAMKNPILLKNKLELQNLARQRLHDEGFQYKKGKSRSSAVSSPQSAVSGTTRKNVTRELREKRLGQLREDLKEVDLQLNFSIQQRNKCSNVHNYSKAVEVSQQIDELRQKKRKYQSEVELLQRKEAACKKVKRSISKKANTTARYTVSHYAEKANTLQIQRAEIDESLVEGANQFSEDNHFTMIHRKFCKLMVSSHQTGTTWAVLIRLKRKSRVLLFLSLTTTKIFEKVHQCGNANCLR